MTGTSTLPVELTHVSRHGLWVLVGDKELFLPFDYFPWFKAGSIEQLSAVERPTTDHLHWPLLDIDLSIESIPDPSSFPLVARHTLWVQAFSKSKNR